MNIAWFLFSFNSRIGRGPYWLFTVAIMVVVLGPAVLIFGADDTGDHYVDVMSIILLWPSLAVHAKRWHDRDKSAWWLLINLVPVIGFLWALVENGFLAGVDEENRLGTAQRDSAMPRVTLQGYMMVAEDDLAAVKAEVENHMTNTRAERGCLTFEVSQDQSNPCRYHDYRA